MGNWKTNWVDGETVHSADINRIEENGKANEAAIEEINTKLEGSADANHTHTLDAIKETANKKIMTSAERAKLKVIQEGANNYVHPSHTPASSGLYKVTVDSSGHITSVTAVQKSDITALGIPGENTDTRYSLASADSSGLLSSVDKKKLDGIEDGANNYVHPTHTARTIGLYKIIVNNQGHVTGVAAVSKSDITGLGIPGQDTVISYSDATESSSGLMSATDKKKTNKLNYNDTYTHSVGVGGSDNTISGDYGVVGGKGNTVAACSAVFGQNNSTADSWSFAANYKNKAKGYCSTVFGEDCISNLHQFVFGYKNIEKTGSNVDSQSSSDTLFIIGNGTSSAKSNAVKLTADGKLHLKNGTGADTADFAEYFEWADGNSNGDDRRGKFVTLDGEKIKLANSGDYILGIVSAAPAFIGNLCSDDWQGKYLKDVFGSIIMTEVDVPETVDERTGEIIPAHTVEQFAVNPDYDPKQEYISREFRQEWSPVGMLGQMVVVDDGTCQVNGYCMPSIDGVGTAADTGYRVMKRIDDTHIKVLVK